MSLTARLLAVSALAIAAGMAARPAPLTAEEELPGDAPVLVDAPALSVRVTYYLWTGNPTSSGYWPRAGSAAGSWNLPLGSLVEMPDGYIVIILDRGHLGSTGWVDLYARSHHEGREFVRRYGDYTTVRVLRWGWGE